MRQAHLSLFRTGFLCGIQLPAYGCCRVPYKAFRHRSPTLFIQDACWFLRWQRVPSAALQRLQPLHGQELFCLRNASVAVMQCKPCDVNNANNSFSFSSPIEEESKVRVLPSQGNQKRFSFLFFCSKHHDIWGKCFILSLYLFLFCKLFLFVCEDIVVMAFEILHSKRNCNLNFKLLPFYVGYHWLNKFYKKLFI